MNNENFNTPQSLCKECMDNRITQKMKKMQKIMMSIYYNRQRSQLCENIEINEHNRE